MKQQIIDRILKKTGIPNLVDALAEELSPGELQSLLFKVIELKTQKKEGNELLKEYQENRFSKASDIDPVLHRKLEINILSLLPDDFKLIELSPLTPLGTTSVLTTVHQNNIVPTIRNLEVAADTTNMLALECALRRKVLLKKNSKNTERIKLCSAQRLVRAQPFDNPAFSAHFCVVALCSAGKDEGNDKFEIVNLKEHIFFYLNLIEKLLDQSEIKKINIKLFKYPDSNTDSIIENIKKELSDRAIVHFKIQKNSDFGRNYYSRLRFMISIINNKNREFDYIDGGFTNWTSKLLNNNKERLLTSGIGTDILLRTIKIIV